MQVLAVLSSVESTETKVVMNVQVLTSTIDGGKTFTDPVTIFKGVSSPLNKVIMDKDYFDTVAKDSFPLMEGIILMLECSIMTYGVTQYLKGTEIMTYGVTQVESNKRFLGDTSYRCNYISLGDVFLLRTTLPDRMVNILRTEHKEALTIFKQNME